MLTLFIMAYNIDFIVTLASRSSYTGPPEGAKEEVVPSLQQRNAINPPNFSLIRDENEYPTPMNLIIQMADPSIV
jgi:hypothetical protein